MLSEMGKRPLLFCKINPPKTFFFENTAFNGVCFLSRFFQSFEVFSIVLRTDEQDGIFMNSWTVLPMCILLRPYE